MPLNKRVSLKPLSNDQFVQSFSNAATNSRFGTGLSAAAAYLGFADGGRDSAPRAAAVDATSATECPSAVFASAAAPAANSSCISR